MNDEFKIEPWGKIFKELGLKIIKGIGRILLFIISSIFLLIVIAVPISLADYFGLSDKVGALITFVSIILYFLLLFCFLLSKSKKKHCKKIL